MSPADESPNGAIDTTRASMTASGKASSETFAVRPFGDPPDRRLVEVGRLELPAGRVRDADDDRARCDGLADPRVDRRHDPAIGAVTVRSSRAAVAAARPAVARATSAVAASAAASAASRAWRATSRWARAVSTPASARLTSAFAARRARVPEGVPSRCASAAVTASLASSMVAVARVDLGGGLLGRGRRLRLVRRRRIEGRLG